MKQVISRIGISPVGSAKYRVNRLRLHILAYAISRKAQLNGDEGVFIIRCDDTDKDKAKREYLASYIEVLSSLGIRPTFTPLEGDEEGRSLYQSERSSIYKRYLDQLTSMGLAYGHESGAIYFNTKLFAELFKDLLSVYSLTAKDVAMGDLLIDIRSTDPSASGNLTLKDFPVVRSNGEYLYNFCSPVDDGVMKVTHVVRDRGKLDLLSKQEMVRISLGFPPVLYAHTPILVDVFGKRFTHDPDWGDATLQDFVQKGILQEGLISYLLSTLFGPSEHTYATIDEFCLRLELSRLHAANTVFTPSVLLEHNKHALQRLSNEEYMARVREFFDHTNPRVLEYIDSDKNLFKLLGDLKRSLYEIEGIVEYLTSPRYDPFLLKKYFEQLEGNPTGAEYYKALRYILTGQEKGIGLDDMISYLKEAGLFKARMEGARRINSSYE